MTLEELKNAVAGLSPEELSHFRTWFLATDAELWDREIEEDVAAGRLDHLADEALREHRAGLSREL